MPSSEPVAMMSSVSATTASTLAGWPTMRSTLSPKPSLRSQTLTVPSPLPTTKRCPPLIWQIDSSSSSWSSDMCCGSFFLDRMSITDRKPSPDVVTSCRLSSKYEKPEM